jgi:hypothetical protein
MQKSGFLVAQLQHKVRTYVTYIVTYPYLEA